MTRSGWAVIVAGVVLGASGLVTRQPALVALGIACLASMACSMATMLVRPRLTLVRSPVGSRVTAGESITVELTVTNTSARPSAATVGTDALGGEPVRVALPSVSGHGERTVSYELPAARRGVFTLAPLVVTRPDPLGLTSVAPITSTDDLTVWVHPRTVPVAPIPAGYRLSEDGPTGSEVHQGALVFHSLREYVVGDDIRHIHWRSSAHAGDLLVRQNLETTTPTATVIVDTRSSVHTEASFEQAIEIAASLVTASLPFGVPVILATTGGRTLAATNAEIALDELAELSIDDDASLARLDGPDRRGPGSVGGGSDGLVFVTGSPRGADATPLAAWCARAANATVVLVDPGGRSGLSTELARVTAQVWPVSSTEAFAARWNQRHR